MIEYEMADEESAAQEAQRNQWLLSLYEGSVSKFAATLTYLKVMDMKATFSDLFDEFCITEYLPTADILPDDRVEDFLA